MVWGVELVLDWSVNRAVVLEISDNLSTPAHASHAWNELGCAGSVGLPNVAHVVVRVLTCFVFLRMYLLVVVEVHHTGP